MKNSLYLRAQIINFIKRHENYIVFGAKFIAGLFIFGFIFSINLYASQLEPLFTAPLSIPFMVLLAVGFAFFPPTANFLLIALITTAQLSASIEASSFALLIMLAMVLFYVRISPKNSYLILAIMIGFFFRIPYAVVIFSGLYVGLAAMLPIALGTFLFFHVNVLLNIARYTQMGEDFDFLSLPSKFVDAYTEMFTSLTAEFSWVIISFVFVMVIFGIYAVSKLSIDYAKEMAIAFGGIVCMMCFFMAAIVIDEFELSVAPMLLGSVVSVGLVFLLRFFDGLPDYQKTEFVTFEDDENFYHCKIVPKTVYPETAHQRKTSGKIAAEKRQQTNTSKQPTTHNRAAGQTLTEKQPALRNPAAHTQRQNYHTARHSTASHNPAATQRTLNNTHARIPRATLPSATQRRLDNHQLRPAPKPPAKDD